VPPSVQIGVLVLGAVLILIGILGGKFTIFGANVAEKISNQYLRGFSIALGVGFVGIAILLPLPQLFFHLHLYLLILRQKSVERKRNWEHQNLPLA